MNGNIEKEKIERIAELITNSEYLVAMTGAGISTESGLPDYRGPEGVWTLRDKGLKPKRLQKPMSQIEPNAGHFALVELQNLGILKFLISQNVDNLHLKSGINPEILAELHGNHSLMKCLSCDSRFTKMEIKWDEKIFGRGYRTSAMVEGQPTCPKCHGRIISSVVNFQDPMPEREMQIATERCHKSDVVLAIGSTLSVSPASDFPIIAIKSGAKFIILNLGPTELDKIADIRITGKAGEILPRIMESIKGMKD